MSDYCKWFIIVNNQKFEVDYISLLQLYDREYAHVYDDQNKSAGYAKKIIQIGTGENMVEVYLHGKGMVASRKLDDLKSQSSRDIIIDMGTCTNKGD